MVWVIEPIYKSATKPPPVAEEPSVEVKSEHVDSPPHGSDGRNVMADDEPESTEPPSTESSSEENSGDAAPETEEPEVPEEQKIRGRNLGQAPLPGVGMVPVLFLGSFTKGGARLKTYAAGLSDDPFYGAALIGRDVDKRKLTLVAFGEEVVTMKKSEVGAIVWDGIDEAARAVEGEK